MADANLFTSYLLKLQETHLQMVKKLQDEVHLQTKRCQKIQTFANQNACYAKKYYTKCKLLLNEREKMKAKVKELMKDRTCKQCKALKDQNKTHLDTSTETKSPSPVLSSTNGSEVSPVKKSKGKLSRKKGKNMGAPTDVMISPVMSRGENSKDSMIEFKNLKSKNDGKEQFDVSESAIGAGGDHHVFVPETFAPDMSLNFSYDGTIPVIDMTGVENSLVTIPDTCAFHDDDVIMLKTQDNLLKGPQYCSTQIVPQLHDALPNADKSHHVEDDDVTMIHTQDTVLKAPQYSSTPSIPKVKKMRPDNNQQQKNMEKHVKRHANRRSSLPKSESQYPVDLVNTQIPSPTFQRDAIALTKEEEEKVTNASKILSFFAQKTPTSDVQKTPIAVVNRTSTSDVQKTPKAVAQKTPISLAQQTPTSVRKGNESYLSDTSPLLLRESRVDFQRTTFVNKTCNQGSDEIEEISSYSKKRKLADVDMEYIKTKSSNSLESKRNRQDNIVQEVVLPKQTNNSPTKYKLVQKTLTTFNGSKPCANSVIKEFNRRNICGSDDTQNDIYFKQAIEESLQEQKMSEFKKPVIPVHKRTPSGDDSFLNGTIDPAIDLSEFDENTPRVKEVIEQATSNQKPTSVVMTSGMVCIVKEVPFIQENTSELPRELPTQGFQLCEEDDNLSHDDMFSGDEEHEAHNDEPDISDEISNDVSDGKLPGNSFFKNFDAVPSVGDEKPQYKYVEVVRKQVDRRKLRGFECKDCEAYFSTMHLTDSQKADRMKSCSRHRGNYSPPSTQPHYWDVDFPDTETCVRRGYINNAPQVEEQEDTRKLLGRRKRYKQNFRSKTGSTSKLDQ